MAHNIHTDKAEQKHTQQCAESVFPVMKRPTRPGRIWVEFLGQLFLSVCHIPTVQGRVRNGHMRVAGKWKGYNLI